MLHRAISLIAWPTAREVTFSECGKDQIPSYREDQFIRSYRRRVERGVCSRVADGQLRTRPTLFPRLTLIIDGVAFCTDNGPPINLQYRPPIKSHAKMVG
jgi:hypothetical protein